MHRRFRMPTDVSACANSCLLLLLTPLACLMTPSRSGAVCFNAPAGQDFDEDISTPGVLA
jgi:hypothetical protein